VTNRSLAVSLVLAGMGVAPMPVSPFARWLISTCDWRPAMMSNGIFARILLTPAALLVQFPPTAMRIGVNSGPQAVSDGAGMSAAQVLRSPPFAVLALTFFFHCAAHSGPILHRVSYANGCGCRPWQRSASTPLSAGRARSLRPCYSSKTAFRAGSHMASVAKFSGVCERANRPLLDFGQASSSRAGTGVRSSRRSCETSEATAKGVFSLPLRKSNSGEQPVGLDGSDCVGGRPLNGVLGSTQTLAWAAAGR
jgi:hypothetical protein